MRLVRTLVNIACCFEWLLQNTHAHNFGHHSHFQVTVDNEGQASSWWTDCLHLLDSNCILGLHLNCSRVLIILFHACFRLN